VWWRQTSGFCRLHHITPASAAYSVPPPSSPADAVNGGRLLEAFGAGTAAVVSPVKLIHYDGKDYTIPLDPADPAAGAGPLAKRVWSSLSDIQYGRVPHEWSVKIA
jgi:branched-chain amino acid aminotransferase